MATSSFKSGNAPPASSSEGAPHNTPRAAGSPANTGSSQVRRLTDLVSQPVYSFSADASPEFQAYVAKVTEAAARYIEGNFAISALGGDIEKPFSATRDGEVIHIVFPQHVREGDLLGGLLTILAAQIPTCVIHQGTAGWSEPEWTAESRAHLAGIVAGIRDIPNSFSHTTSPTDLARISLWISTCSAALSRPGGVADAQGDVLPSAVAGGRSASKYMTRVIQGLRANVTDEAIMRSIDTLALLLKAWQRAHYDDALTIVRKCKLPWSSVLYRGAPTERIRGKKGRPDTTVIRSPPKPSRSPWLSSAERSELGNLFKDKWSALESIRTEWTALSAEQQHRQFNGFIRRVKQHYESLNNISNSVHAKLGKRKQWIERLCKEDGYKPKVKRDESESFLLTAHFFSKDLTKLDNSVKRIFAPVTYYPDEDGKQQQIWSSLILPDAVNHVEPGDFNLEDEGETFRLWSIWADIFKPVFQPNNPAPAEAQPTEDRNIFSRLLGLSQDV